MLSWTTHDVAGVLVITLEPSPVGIDERQAKERQALYEIIQTRPDARFAVDLGRVDYVSSADIGFLITIRRRTDVRKGKLVALRRQFLHPRLARHDEALAAVPDRRRPGRRPAALADGVGPSTSRKRSSDHDDPPQVARVGGHGARPFGDDGRGGPLGTLAGTGRPRLRRQGRRGRSERRPGPALRPRRPARRREDRIGDRAGRRRRRVEVRRPARLLAGGMPSSRPAARRPTSTSSHTASKRDVGSTSTWSSRTVAR